LTDVIIAREPVFWAFEVDVGKQSIKFMF